MNACTMSEGIPRQYRVGKSIYIAVTLLKNHMTPFPKPICFMVYNPYDLQQPMMYDLQFELKAKKACRVNTLRPRRNEQHFADDIFKRIFFNENVWLSIKISLKFVPRGPINNMPALVQIMAWRRSGDKPLSEPMMVSLPTHICVTRPQWVKQDRAQYSTEINS